MAPSSVFRTRLLTLGQAAVIVLATAWVYAPAIHGGWLWDDDVEITGNAVLRDAGGIRKIWLAPSGADYFPLKTTVQWVQWRLWHEHVTGYHLTNIGLHLLGALLVWRVLVRLGGPFDSAPFDSAQGRQGIRPRWGGVEWLAGLIFAIHPLAVESVAWISELKNVLSLPLLLLAFGAWIEWDRKRGTGFQPVIDKDTGGMPVLHQFKSHPSAFWYTLALLFFLAAMLSKSSVVMFPFILLLYAWWKRGRVARGDWLAAAPFFAISLGLGLVTMWFQAHRALAGQTVLTGGLLSRVAAAGLALGFYLWKAVWPWRLMPIYPRWRVDPPALWQFWPWLVMGAAVYVIWRVCASEELGGLKRRRGVPPRLEAAECRFYFRTVAFGLGWFFLNLVPVLGFVPMSFLRLSWVSDHFAYLSLAGIAGLAAAGIGPGLKVAQARTPALLFIPAILLAALAVDARHYAGRFADPRTLWTYNLARNPWAWAARNNLGNALLEAGLVREATANYEEALRLHPDYAEVCNNLGNIYSQTGRPEEAAAMYARALQLQPDYAQARNGLGNLLSETGHVPEAVAQFERALQISPDFADARNNLGNLFFQVGRYPEAEAQLSRALQVRPDYPEAHNNLGNVYLRTGRTRDALAEYREALRLKPNFPEALNNVGNVQMMAGQLSEAVASFDQALRFRPDYAEAHYNLGLIFAGTGRTGEAMVQFRLALQSRPDFRQARAKLAEMEQR